MVWDIGNIRLIWAPLASKLTLHPKYNCDIQKWIMWCFRKFEAKTTKTWNCQISLWMRLTAREVSLAFQSAKVVYIHQTFVSRQFCCHWKFLTATNVCCKLRVWRVFNLSIVANRNFWWQQNHLFEKVWAIQTSFAPSFATLASKLTSLDLVEIQCKFEKSDQISEFWKFRKTSGRRWMWVFSFM